MTAPADRKKLREIIAALKARTEANGCTEAEAMTAAEKVAELLSKHGMDDAAELEFDQWRVEIGRRTVVDKLWGYVATFCHCKLWYQKDFLSKGWTVVYFGRWNDVAVAEYLHGMLDHHITSATKAFKKTKDYTRRRSPKTKREATKAFQEGMVNALADKLWTIQWRRVPRVEGTNHQALVLSPLGAVEAELERRGMTFSSKGLAPVKGTGKRFDNERAGGAAAGRSVDINAAMTGTRSGGAAGLLGRAE